MPITLVVDSEFKSIIPPLTDIEFNGLEKQLLADGCRDALKVWDKDGELIILDGHNRYAICQKHEIEFVTDTIEIDSREHAINWIIDHQLGRRNLSEAQKSYLRGKRYETEKKMWGGDHGSKNAGISNNPSTQAAYMDPKRTCEQIGKQCGVSCDTIQRDELYANGIDKIKASDPELAQKILVGSERGGVKVPKIEIRALGRLSPSEVSDVLKGGISVHSDQRQLAEKTRLEHNRVVKEAREFSAFNGPVAEKIAKSNAQMDRIMKSTGGACLLPNLSELWCNRCKWGFDVYLPTPSVPHCPYCMGEHLEKRNEHWNSRDVI